MENINLSAFSFLWFSTSVLILIFGMNDDFNETFFKFFAFAVLGYLSTIHHDLTYHGKQY